MVITAFQNFVSVGKEEVKLSLFTDDIMLHLRAKMTHGTTGIHTRRDGKVEGYEINTQKSIAFVYTNNTVAKKEGARSVSFTKM